MFSNFVLAQVLPGNAVVRLVTSLGSANEDTSMAAYMALVKLGGRKRISGILLDEAANGNQTAAVLQVLGDLGDPTLIAKLEHFAASEDAKVAEAARESIVALREVAQERH